MGSHQTSANSESAIWSRLVEMRDEPISPETASYLLSFRLSEADRSRMQELIDKSNEGTLTREDEAEFDSYLNIADLLTVMHSQARLAIRSLGAEPLREVPSS